MFSLTCQLDGNVIDERHIRVDELGGVLCSLESTEMIAGEKSLVPGTRVSQDLKMTCAQWCATVDLQSLCHHPDF